MVRFRSCLNADPGSQLIRIQPERVVNMKQSFQLNQGLIAALLIAMVGTLASEACAQEPSQAIAIRVMTFNLEDVRTEDLKNGDNPRLKALAQIIQRIRPTVLFLNEIAYDLPEGDKPGGTNAQRFADLYLGVSQGPGLKPMRFRGFMQKSNTGMASGFDLNRDGTVQTQFPTTGAKDKASRDMGRAYGGDCWGFGTFPGQYAMALLVDDRLEILEDQVRTFRLLPWDYIPGAFLPNTPDGTEPWFDDEERAAVRLSSKSHWDVPVRLPGRGDDAQSGRVVHFLCSHPTPPAFDGPEKRNGKRNHDEIRFWADYVTGASYIVDDKGTPGSLAPDQLFVILGDLNADPDEGSSYKDPIGTVLKSCNRINWQPAPTADVVIDGLDIDDTAAWGLRVDYVLISQGLSIRKSGIWRRNPENSESFPSDHFPVWAEIEVPGN